METSPHSRTDHDAGRRAAFRLGPLGLSLLAMLLGPVVASLRADDAKKMNVLLIVGDDHAASALGCYGNPRIKTPHLDKLAAGGMRFERAYCNSPVCTASRQSFITGRMPQSVGVTLLTTWLGEQATTLAHVLGSEGYATLAAGKMHFNNPKPGYDEQWLRHGFGEVLELEQSQKRIQMRGVREVDSSIPVQPMWRPFNDPARIWLNAANLPWPAYDADMTDEDFVYESRNFMRNPPRRPWFVVTSLKATHSPFVYPIEFAGRYDPKVFEPPEPGPEDGAQIPLIFKDLTRQEKQGITAAYYTAAEYLDECVGRTLDGLEKSGEAENTIVIYIGDHGYCLGDHGRFEKHCMYEQAVRAPLIVRWPGHTTPGGVSGALVEFIDLFPTIAEVCGVPIPPEVEGRSLVPVLEGRRRDHREMVTSVYFENEEAMVRDQRYKLIYTTGKRERQDHYTTANPLPGRTIRLYDETADPGEMHNIADDPANREILGSLMKELFVRLRQGRNFDPPRELSMQDALDLYLIPPEVQREADADLKMIQTK